MAVSGLSRKGRRNRFGQWVRYVVARGLVAALLPLPWRPGRSIARRLGDLVRVLDEPQRKVRMTRDISDAFSHLSSSQAKAIVKKVYQSLCASSLDALEFWQVALGKGCRDHIELKGSEALGDSEDNAGIMFATGPLGYWEVMGFASAAVGYPVLSLGRSPNNAFLDGYVRKLCESSG